MRIRAKESSELLLKVIKNPVIDHIPMYTPIVSTNEKSRLVDLDEFTKNLIENGNQTIAFVVGAISKGDVEIDYNNDSISISSYPLTAGVVCSKLCNSLEKQWNIL